MPQNGGWCYSHFAKEAVALVWRIIGIVVGEMLVAWQLPRDVWWAAQLALIGLFFLRPYVKAQRDRERRDDTDSDE